MEEYKKSFKYWKTQEVEDVFGIQPATDKTRMTEWEGADCEITEREKEEILSLQAHLISKVKYWNEAALKFYFLGPFIRMIHYDTDKYSSFLEHSLKLEVSKDIIISGNVDFLVATGKQIPKIPFLTLHEYKPEPNVSSDPQGQLLVSMVAAQRANTKKGINYPLFGAYVTGRLWFFIILEGNNYIESLAYDATQKDIFKIFCMLRKTKEYINSEVDELLAKK